MFNLVGRRLFLGLIILALAIGFVPIRADAQRLPPGGAPPPGSGPKDVDGFVRVVDGDSLDTYIDGNRAAVGLVGINAPQGNTDCGRQATAALRELVKGGIRLEEDPEEAFDGRNRRMYQVKTRDGRTISEELLRSGVVRANGKGATKQQLAAAETEARAASRGCLARPGAATDGDDTTVTTVSPGGDDTTLGKVSPDGDDTTFAKVSLDDAAQMAQPLASPDDLQAIPIGAAEVAVGALPSGFTQDNVAGGLTAPTAMAFLPDGRILIAQQSGVVRIYKNGALLTTPFIDIQTRVNDQWDHGLLGIAADPGFATNGHIYLLYTYENDSTDYNGPKTGRLARYTATFVNGVPGDTALPATELVILGKQFHELGCNSLPAGADCIPSEGLSHSVGNIKFAHDGTLFMTTGDASSFTVVDDNALRAQNLDSFAGKIIRINPNGTGVSDNPFWNGNADANRSKIWGYGLRNPYRFNLRPGTLVPYVGDVGWNDREEVSTALRGANMGWPCYEGDAVQDGYASKQVCRTLYGLGSSAVEAPLVAWTHNDGGSCCGAAATGGAFLTGTAYPAQYQGAYFYADFAKEWIRYLRVDGSDNLVPGSVNGFATDPEMVSPVDLEVGPDHNLYYLAINAGQLRRIRYTAAGNRPPVANASATPLNGGAPLNVQFSSAGSNDPDGDTLTYSWNFGDQTPVSNLANPEHTYAANGTYTATLTVSDGRGGTAPDTVRIDVGVGPPVATITAPSPSLRYKVGDVITFSGSATDPDLGTPVLSWTVVTHHCPGGTCHQHTATAVIGSSGQFEIEDHGDDSHYEVRLTATDDDGLSDTKSVTILPQTVQITLATNPAGLQVIYDGTTGVGPMTRTTIVNSEHSIEARHQTGYLFGSWSDNGPSQHNVTIGATNTTYTATFTAVPTVNFNDKSGQDQPLNGQYPSGVIDWGTGKWYHAGPYGGFSTKSASFSGSGITSQTFNFITARKLVSVDAYNGGGGSTNVTLSCGSQTKTQAVPAGQVATISTGWTVSCTTVTVASSNGWDTNFDNIVHDSAGPPPPDTTAPIVTNRTPAANATGVAVDANVMATFSEDVTDVSGTTFQLKDLGSNVIQASVTYDIATKTATLNPNAALTGGVQYTATVKGGVAGCTTCVKDTAGNPLAADATWTFNTAAAPPPDTTPPTVTTRTPASAATNVPVDTNVSAVFSEDVTGVGGTTFQLRDGSNNLVTATVNYSPATRTATLDPGAALANNTTYTATLTGGASAIHDLANPANQLTTTSWSFTTAAAGTMLTVTFDDKPGQDQALNGQYPSGVINWGTNTWYHSGPWGLFTTKSVSFNGGGVTSRSFTFINPRRLESVRAFNGGGGQTTVTLSCAGQPTKTQTVPAGQAATIATGWTGTCTSVTIGSSNGWDTNFDDLVVHAGP